MLTQQQISEVVRDSLVAVNDEKPADDRFTVNEETVLLGSGSALDSLDFILVVSNVEDRLLSLTGKQYQLVSGMEAFDGDHPFRTASTLSAHIMSVLGTPGG